MSDNVYPLAGEVMNICIDVDIIPSDHDCNDWECLEWLCQVCHVSSDGDDCADFSMENIFYGHLMIQECNRQRSIRSTQHVESRVVCHNLSAISFAFWWWKLCKVLQRCSVCGSLCSVLEIPYENSIIATRASKKICPVRTKTGVSLASIPTVPTTISG